MTQEEKSILLQDLCIRLPYNLYVRIEEFNVPKNEAITEGFIGNYLKDNRCNDYDADGILNELADDCINVKSYLRPMSSMTEEERKEYNDIVKNTIDFYNCPKSEEICFFITPIDWLNAHHFDYRGLIPKGLAIAVTEKNNPYK